MLTIEAQWFDISFLNVHAPTEDKSQDEKETFYEQLESLQKPIPSDRIQIVLGYLNAKVGKETMFRQVAGKYSLHDETNDNGHIKKYVHLTNYSINRLSSRYTENEDADACQGHKWTLRSLWTYMEKGRKIDVKKLWKSLEDLVVKTVISGESPMAMSQMCSSNLCNRYNAYELFGIDVLFDEYLKPWILEVNISPSLHSSSPLDLAVKGPLVKDLMNMAGYHIPNKMSHSTHNYLLKVLGVKSILCYDKRLYTLNLSAKEKEKEEYYTNIESREEYIDSILDDLLPDNIRHLIVYEDEITQVGSFQKVFPTTSSSKYHKYFDSSRYYNMLLDAWECKYSNNRGEGTAVLEKLCQLKIHLEVPDIDEEE
ncbi:unnamed protein product [Macrosiphum euphorbiae]|uniref:Tubulin polyglutamylase TTLL4 n=1 Tax=Macrosiphum euphorbiae TaxID=13131 RepID=A0AAV0XI27_9HEMI|nr:unnamed protein product [Macrosiphum euphorbiae]